MNGGANTGAVASALTAAARGGYDTIVRMILENDARISAAGSNYASDASERRPPGRGYHDTRGDW